MGSVKKMHSTNTDFYPVVIQEGGLPLHLCPVLKTRGVEEHSCPVSLCPNTNHLQMLLEFTCIYLLVELGVTHADKMQLVKNWSI